MAEAEQRREGVFSKGAGSLDASLLERIRAAYRRAVGPGSNEVPGVWTTFAEKSREIHEALLSRRGPIPELDAPATADFFYGFDGLCLDFTSEVKRSNERQKELLAVYARDLVLLAEATCAKRVGNPEAEALLKPPVAPIEELLSSIEVQIGAPIDFPNPFPDEFGIATSRGLISYRATHGIYQAWRLKTLGRQYGGRVLEIGGGLGRTAYYAKRFGLADYTIVDIPHTNVAQAVFLGRTLGAASVSLFGEPRMGRIRIVPPQWLQETDEKFDIVLNADSLTEMDGVTAACYAEFFVERGKVLLSINHEASLDTAAGMRPLTVAGLKPLKGRSAGRFPYWIRPGYVEEIFLGDLA